MAELMFDMSGRNERALKPRGIRSSASGQKKTAQRHPTGYMCWMAEEGQGTVKTLLPNCDEKLQQEWYWKMWACMSEDRRRLWNKKAREAVV